MNENIDLTKILKNCPEGFPLYSTIYGNVTVSKIGNNVIEFIYFYKRIFQRHFFHALINYNNNLQTNEQNIQNLYIDKSILQK